ncbi:rhoptry neck protein RON5 [Cyclospora cayetanensis]|uniref:Rhoptry neck protein RON5 n=1 Tax=Cyclospora cayetanensis TaxID=88456 RepID=A0A1D3D6M3_9EIME|nr:rhoptry neck protein RON5 [Cyclospora cayetanensis]
MSGYASEASYAEPMLLWMAAIFHVSISLAEGIGTAGVGMSQALTEKDDAFKEVLRSDSKIHASVGDSPPSTNFAEYLQLLASRGGTSLQAGAATEESAQVTAVQKFVSQMKLLISLSNRISLEEPARYCAEDKEGTSFCMVLKEYAASLQSYTDVDCVPRRLVMEQSSKSKSQHSVLLQQTAVKAPVRHGPEEDPSQQKLNGSSDVWAHDLNTQVQQLWEQNKQKLREAGLQGDLENIKDTATTLYKTTAVLNDILIEAINGMAADRGGAERLVTAAMLKLTDLDVLVRHTARRKAEMSVSMDKDSADVDKQLKAEMSSNEYGNLTRDQQSAVVDRVLSVINNSANVQLQVHATNFRGGMGGVSAPPQPQPRYVYRFGPMGMEASGGAARISSGPTGLEKASPEVEHEISMPSVEHLRPPPRMTGAAEVGATSRAPSTPKSPIAQFTSGTPSPFASWSPDAYQRNVGGLTGAELSGVPLAGSRSQRPQGPEGFGSQTTVSAFAPQHRMTSLRLARCESTGVAEESHIALLRYENVAAESKNRGGASKRVFVGARAAMAVENIVAHHIQELKRPPIVLFTSDEDIEDHVKRLWEHEKRKLSAENDPAPSFNQLVSTGCASASSDLRRRFWDAWKDRGLFSAIEADAILSERLRKRVEILAKQDMLPVMPQSLDKIIGGPLQETLANTLHEEKLVNDASVKPQVLASFVFSADHSLMKLDAMLKKAMGYAIAYFKLGIAGQQLRGIDSDEKSNLQNKLKTLLPIFEPYAATKPKKDLFQISFTGDMLEYLTAISRFTNVLISDESTKDTMNLLIHTWIQARAVHMAAEGFKPSASKKGSARSTSLAAIFSKLWFESSSSASVEGQQLKPFGSAIVSAGLQIAFFLHTITEEYRASVLKRMGAAIMSFFASFLNRSRKASLPSSWAVLQQRAAPQQKVNLRQYQGVLTVTEQLSQMFRERFLKHLYLEDGPDVLQAFYIVIQALVGLWMNPFNEPFDLASPRIASAKKLLYYFLFFHPLGSLIDTGKVVDVKDAARQTITDRALYLTRGSLKSIGRGHLVATLNHLMATYVDPITIVKVALDLSQRCKGALQSPRGDTAVEGNVYSAGDYGKRAQTKHDIDTEQPHVRFLELEQALEPEKIDKTKGTSADLSVLQQVLSSKLVVDLWCQKYKETLLHKMAAFNPKSTAADIQKQMDKVLESVSEISISTKLQASNWVISFKCLWMSGNRNQDAFKAERARMANYAIYHPSSAKHATAFSISTATCWNDDSAFATRYVADSAFLFAHYHQKTEAHRVTRNFNNPHAFWFKSRKLDIIGGLSCFLSLGTKHQNGTDGKT